MPIMRSEVKQFDNSWFGFKDCGISSFRDDSQKYDWADVYLVVELSIKGSKYTRPCKIAGSFDKNADGTIADCTLLKRITYMSDALEWDGGVNQFGQWVEGNAEETPIDDIAKYMDLRYGKGEEAPLDYYCYVYREAGKDGKAYTRVYSKFMKNTPDNRKSLESHIEWMKKNKYLKEVAEVADNSNTNEVQVEVDGLNVSNL